MYVTVHQINGEPRRIPYKKIMNMYTCHGAHSANSIVYVETDRYASLSEFPIMCIETNQEINELIQKAMFDEQVEQFLCKGCGE